MRVLIVGSDHARGSLAAVRALSSCGWIVGVGTAHRSGLSSRSRRAHRWHQLPPAEEDPKAFVKATNAAIVEGGYEIVFGSGDAEVFALSASRRSLRAIFPYASHEQLTRALDKKLLGEAAAEAGLSTPGTVAATPEALEEVSFPVVVKSRLHSGTGAAGRIEATFARSKGEALAQVAGVRNMGGQPLLQEAIAGDLVAYSALAGDDSKIVADVQQRADRTWPPGSGVSVRAVTERVDETLRERVTALLSNLEWFGLAQVQFIAPSKGEPVVIDLNPRFYGSLALAVAAGPNLPAAWASIATERPVELQDPRPGVRYQWFAGDVRRALIERRGGVVKDLMSCVACARRSTHSIWDPSDPLPAISYLRMLSTRAVRRLIR